MIKLRRAIDKVTGVERLESSCPFNIVQLSGKGPLAGLCVLVPAPPGATIAWQPVEKAWIDFDSADDMIAMKVPEANKVIAPAGARQPIIRPEGT